MVADNGNGETETETQDAGISNAPRHIFYGAAHFDF